MAGSGEDHDARRVTGTSTAPFISSVSDFTFPLLTRLVRMTLTLSGLILVRALYCIEIQYCARKAFFE